jgi:hypothetical protein
MSPSKGKSKEHEYPKDSLTARSIIRSALKDDIYHPPTKSVSKHSTQTGSGDPYSPTTTDGSGGSKEEAKDGE